MTTDEMKAERDFTEARNGKLLKETTLALETTACQGEIDGAGYTDDRIDCFDIEYKGRLYEIKVTPIGEYDGNGARVV